MSRSTQAHRGGSWSVSEPRARELALRDELTPDACLDRMRLCRLPQYRAAWLQAAHEQGWAHS